jgi:hypothetical protein
METIVLDTPAQINAFRLLALRGALKMESVGLKRRGPSALTLVKKETGIKARTAKDALPLFEAHLRGLGILA